MKNDNNTKEGLLKEVEESELRYRILVEGSGDLIFTVSPDGIITSLNPAFEKISGWKRDEWLGRNFKPLVHPDDLPSVEENYKRLFNGETLPSSIILRILSKSGENVMLEVSIVPQTRDGKVINGLGIARNITESRRIDEKIREEERERFLKDIRKQQLQAEKLSILLKKERDVLNVIMENTGTQLAYLDSKFKFIRVNPAYARGSGLTKEMLLGRNHFELFPSPENQAIFEKVRETGNAVEFKGKPFEFQDQPWRGTTYWDWTLTPVKDSIGQVDRLVLSLIDVTDRIRNEQAIEKALVYAESIVNTVPEPLLILDAHLHVKSANLAFYRTFKVTIEDTIDKYLYELGNRQWDIPELRTLMEDIIPGNNSLLNFEVEHEFPGIGRKTMLLNACRFYQDGAEMILLSIADITERKKLDEIRFENERLISANKARSEFLTIISHELRTPLTSVIGYSIILKGKAQGKLNEKQEFFVDNVLASSKHLLDLINSILDMAKIESGKLEMIFEEISVPETIRETLKLLKEKAAEHKIVLKTEFDPVLPVIKADRQKFKQILFNLLSNAIKFSKDRGGIVTVSAEKEGNMAKISVSDTGIGIKEEDIPKLFQKFEQLDSGISRKYDGTGLGLSITKHLVELHGGKITVKSKYGSGSTFSFLLPIDGKK